MPRRRQTYRTAAWKCRVEGIYLRTCDTCGLLVCESCRNDRYCCDRRADIESEGLPQRGQGKLFDERLLMQDGAERMIVSLNRIR